MADTDKKVDTTQLLKTILATLLRRGFLVLGTFLAGHGVIASGGVGEFVEVGLGVALALVSLGHDVWVNYGHAIVTSQLEVWKAAAVARAQALHKAGVAAPSCADVAARVPDPKVDAAAVAKVVAAGCIAFLLIAFGAPPAFAQSDPGSRNTGARPGPIARAIEQRIGAGGGGDEAENIFNDIRKATLADLEYASKLARAQSPPDTLAANCWDAWAARLRAEEDANLGPEPEPHLVTALQRAMNVRNSLQPESPFMVACTPLVNKLKTDIRKFVGLVITGGAGLGRLLPGIP